MSENGNGNFTAFKGEEERARETKWRTGFIVVMDEKGRVFVDPATANFKNQINHECTTDEAIFILSTALEDFKLDRVRAMLMEAVKVSLIRASREGHAIMKAGG